MTLVGFGRLSVHRRMMPRHKVSAFRAVVWAATFGAVATVLLPRGAAAAQLSAERNPLEVCAAEMRDTQLRTPDSRIERKDFSGQDLTARDFHGKVLLDVKLRSAKL